MTLLPDWKDVLKHAWSVRVLAALAVVDFLAAGVILFVDGMAATLIEDHTIALISALAAKSAFSVGGIYLRVRVQKEAEEIIGVENHD